MNLESIQASLDEERTSRTEEIYFLRSQLAYIIDSEKKDRYRRSLVLMLYAHYEGFCKFALLQYVDAINHAGLQCRDAVAAVVASSWEKEFVAIEYPSNKRKDKILKALLPETSKLHRLARLREFVERHRDFEEMIANIPETLINTESNLLPDVLKKNLYMLGLDHECISEHKDIIQRLLNRRNNIAHGSERNGIKEQVYHELEDAVFNIMNKITSLVMDAIKNESFKKQIPTIQQTNLDHA